MRGSTAGDTDGNYVWFKGRDGTLRRLTGKGLKMYDEFTVDETGTRLATIEQSPTGRRDYRYLVVRDIGTGQMLAKVYVGEAYQYPDDRMSGFQIQSYRDGVVWLANHELFVEEGANRARLASYRVATKDWHAIGWKDGSEFRPAANLAWNPYTFRCIWEKNCQDRPALVRRGRGATLHTMSPDYDHYFYLNFINRGRPYTVRVHDSAPRPDASGTAPLVLRFDIAAPQDYARKEWLDADHIVFSAPDPDSATPQWAIVAIDIRTGTAQRMTALIPGENNSRGVVLSTLPY